MGKTINSFYWVCMFCKERYRSKTLLQQHILKQHENQIMEKHFSKDLVLI